MSGSASDRFRFVTVALLMTTTACSGDDSPRGAAAEPPPPVSSMIPDSPVASADDQPLSDTGLVAFVRRGRGHRYSVSGETRAAPVLQLSVEDADRVLFGPAELEVDDGQFHMEFVTEPSDRTSATVYLATPDGAQQWSIAVPPDSTLVRLRVP